MRIFRRASVCHLEYFLSSKYFQVYNQRPILPWSFYVKSISLFTLSLISSNSSVFIILSWMEQQWKRDRKGRKIYSSNTDSVKLSCSFEVRRRKVFSVCDGQRAPSVSPYLILQFDARAQEAFCALGKHVSTISTIRLDSRAKVPSPFQWTRPRCHRCSLSLIQSPLSLASYELSAPPRVVTLPRAFSLHLVSNCSFSFVLQTRILWKFTCSWEKKH